MGHDRLLRGVGGRRPGQQRADGVGVQCGVPVEALGEGASDALELPGLLRGLHALGDGREPEGAGQACDGSSER